MLPRALFALAVLLAAEGAIAEPLPREVRLSFTREPGTEDCPPEDVLRTAIRKEMRFDPFNPHAPTHLHVTLSGDALHHQVRGVAEMRDRSGALLWSEPFDPTHCDLAIAALGVAIANALDPPLSPPPAAALPSAAAPPSAATPPLPSPPGANATPPRIAGTAAAEPKEEASIRFGFGLGASLEYAAAPSDYSGYVAVDFVLRTRDLTVLLEGQGQPPAGMDIPGFELNASRVGAALMPCAHWEILFGCGLLQLSAVLGSSDAPTGPDAGAGLRGAAGVRLGLEIPLFRKLLALQFCADLAGVFQRPALRFYGDRRWVSPPLAGGLGLRGLAFF